MTDYRLYARRAPPGKLQQIMDEEHESDLHLSKIAEELDEQMMANKLCPLLGLRGQDITAIQRVSVGDTLQMR